MSLFFLVDLLPPHFLCMFSLLKPLLNLPCCLSPLCKFPPPPWYSLLLTAVSHSPGISLLQRCISLSVSVHSLSHCHPQHAINIALADSYVFIMEVSTQHQHLILVACVFASVSSYAEIFHINVCLILFVKFQHR